jgi:uncharacterized membrane protein
MLGCAIAYTILTLTLLALHDSESELHRAIGDDRKGKVSLLCYATAFVLAFFEPWLSIALFVAVALMWIVPDRRIARIFQSV